MSDSYQAIYDAVRSRIGGCDVGSAVESVLRDAQISFYVDRAMEDFRQAVSTYVEPSVIYRPKLSIDGDQWCALYGDNLQDGVAGFGRSPSAAMDAFNRAWFESLSDGAKRDGSDE